jgi:hypothetical protein
VLIKMDVEGFEPTAFASASGLFENHKYVSDMTMSPPRSLLLMFCFSHQHITCATWVSYSKQVCG